MQPHLIAGKPASTRILLVDDEESILKVLARTLAPLGYAIDTALDAYTALDIMQARRADVALVDIRMPVADGFWLIDQLQQKYPATAIVIITGMRELDPRLTLRPGIIGYLTKPFEGAKVRELVQKAVAQAAAVRPSEPFDIANLPDIDHDE